MDQTFLKQLYEKLNGPKYVVPPPSYASITGLKQSKPKVIETNPKTTMENKSNSNPKEDHQGVKLEHVGDEPETKNGNQLNVENQTKVKKTTFQLIEIKEIEDKTNLDILLNEKRFDSWRKLIQKTLSKTTNGNKSGEPSAPINNQEGLSEEITKPKSGNSNDQTPSTSPPKPDLATSNDKNNVLDIKNTQDILAMCIPKSGAVSKQPKNTGCEKQNDKNNKNPKNEKSTQADSQTSVINAICQAFEEARMLQDFSNQTSITTASNRKIKPQVKAVDPRVIKGVKIAPQQFEEKYVLRDITEMNKESKTSVVKPTDFKVIDEKEKHQQTPSQQKDSKAANKDEIKRNKTSGEATEKENKKEER